MAGPMRVLSAMRTYLLALSDARVGSFLIGLHRQMEERNLEPRGLPCLDNLSRIVEAVDGAERRVAETLAENAGTLRWGQTYTQADFGRTFMEGYGWCEIFGARGHFANESVAGGFLLLGPHLVYPDHHHIAEEIYVPLTGNARWRKGGSGFIERAAGEVIHHPSNVSHAMMTGDAPLLSLYLWRGGPLDQRSTIAAVI